MQFILTKYGAISSHISANCCASFSQTFVCPELYVSVGKIEINIVKQRLWECFTLLIFFHVYSNMCCVSCCRTNGQKSFNCCINFMVLEPWSGTSSTGTALQCLSASKIIKWCSTQTDLCKVSRGLKRLLDCVCCIFMKFNVFCICWYYILDTNQLQNIVMSQM